MTSNASMWRYTHIGEKQVSPQFCSTRGCCERHEGARIKLLCVGGCRRYGIRCERSGLGFEFGLGLGLGLRLGLGFGAPLGGLLQLGTGGGARRHGLPHRHDVMPDRR